MLFTSSWCAHASVGTQQQQCLSTAQEASTGCGAFAMHPCIMTIRSQHASKLFYVILLQVVMLKQRQLQSPPQCLRSWQQHLQRLWPQSLELPPAVNPIMCASTVGVVSDCRVPGCRMCKSCETRCCVSIIRLHLHQIGCMTRGFLFDLQLHLQEPMRRYLFVSQARPDCHMHPTAR